MTDQDVIDLVALGFSENVILDKIRMSPGADFDTSVRALKELKAAKVPESVIRAMINARPESPSNAVQAAAPSSMSPVMDVGFYFVINGVLTEAQPEIVNWQTGGFAKTHATLGLVKGDVNGKISKSTSGIQMPMPMEVIVKTPEGTSVTEYQLLHLHKKDNRREFRAVTGGVIHVSGGAERDDISFEPEKIAERTWRIRINDLSPGEYGFLPPSISSASISSSGKMYTFTVNRSSSEQQETATPAETNQSGLTITVGNSSIGVSTTGAPDERHDGVTLSSVEPGGPADHAGLKANDVILAVAGHYLYKSSELTAEINRHMPGSTVSLRYMRYMTIYDISITIGKRAE